MHRRLKDLRTELSKHARDVLGSRSFNPDSAPQRIKLLQAAGFRGDSSSKKAIKSSMKARGVLGSIATALTEYGRLWSLYNGIVKYAFEALTRDHYVRSNFSLTALVTGQLSSSEPPLQNPARDDMVRGMFSSRFGADGVILELDYGQLHLRIMGNIARCAGFITAYENGVDLHCRTAAGIVMPMPEHEFVQRYKDGDAAVGRARDLGKRINFSTIFEITVEGMSEEFGIPLNKAKPYHERFFKLYPEIRTALDVQHAFATKHGYVVSPTGRVRHLPQAKSTDRIVKERAWRQAGDYLVSNPGRSMTLYAMILMSEWLQERGMRSRVVSQVHDSILHDVHLSELDEVLAAARRFYLDEMHREFVKVTSPIPLVMDGFYGRRWCKGEAVEKVELS
jgi:DNA polymerase-1